MLIFFIVTASFVKERGLDINGDEPPQKIIRPTAAPIFVRLSESGKVWMGDTLVDIRAVRANIERYHAQSPKSSVVIQADDKARTDWLIQIMDQSRAAGVWRISIAEQQ